MNSAAHETHHIGHVVGCKCSMCAGTRNLKNSKVNVRKNDSLLIVNRDEGHMVGRTALCMVRHTVDNRCL
jgi:hypothetical protein